MDVLVDTSAFYAITDKSDTHYSRASQYYYDNLKRKRYNFVTTNFLLVETWLLINSRRRLGYDTAMKFWNDLAVPLLEINREDLEQALSIQSKYEDQEFSLIDCSTLALMTRLDIGAIFCFDSHFEIFRNHGGKTLVCFPQLNL